MPYVSTRLGRWFYEERGRPEDEVAVVCLHGLLFDGGMWRAQLPALGALGRALVFDGPGHGKSEVPPLFGLHDHADALADALVALGVRRALLCGLSWGGMVSMRFALRYPDRVAGLALLDTSAERERPSLRVRYRALALFHELVGMPYAMYSREIAPKSFGRSTLAREPDLVRAAGERLLGFDRRGVARATLAVAVNRTSVLDQLHKIRAPALVLCGADDRATPVAYSERIARTIPGARLVVVPDAGHMTPLERPEAVTSSLVPFFEVLAAEARSGA